MTVGKIIPFGNGRFLWIITNFQSTVWINFDSEYQSPLFNYLNVSYNLGMTVSKNKWIGIYLKGSSPSRVAVSLQMRSGPKRGLEYHCGEMLDGHFNVPKWITSSEILLRRCEILDQYGNLTLVCNLILLDAESNTSVVPQLLPSDEAKSIVSDTWSTDVLASDSETVEQSISCQVTLESQSCLERSLLDASETASQSDAWSTDVLASDTERLQDVDTDDTASVARSDDTARSEVDSEIAQNADETPLDRKDLLDSENMRGDLKTGEKASEALSLKVPDLLCVDIENSCDVPPIVPKSSQLSHEESLSSMQSLGQNKGNEDMKLQFMLNNMCVYTFFDLLTLALQENQEELIKLATGFFCVHAQALLKTVSWKNFLRKNVDYANELLLTALAKCKETNHEQCKKPPL